MSTLSPVISKGDIVLYKGVKYKVEFAGKTKFGFRAKLSYLNGSKEFWVNLTDLTPVSAEVTPTPTKSKSVKEAIEKIKKQAFDLGEGSIKATIDPDKVIDLGTVKKLYFDLGPPDVTKPVSTYSPPKKEYAPPTYATATQIAAIKKLFPNRSYAVPLEKLSFVEADKMIRTRLAEM